MRLLASRYFFQREITHLSSDKIINTYNILLEVAERLELYSVFETILLNELSRQYADTDKKT